MGVKETLLKRLLGDIALLIGFSKIWLQSPKIPFSLLGETLRNEIGSGKKTSSIGKTVTHTIFGYEAPRKNVRPEKIAIAEIGASGTRDNVGDPSLYLVS